MTVSNDDRVAMEIVESMIKRIDHYKFQIAMPFRHLNPNMLDNSQQMNHVFPNKYACSAIMQKWRISTLKK